MAQSKSTKKLFNMAYGLGASVVIIGALFKILHWEFGPLTGGLLLAVGLITEALIFAISAFEPVDDEYDWSLVYPELAGGQQSGSKKQDAKDAKEAEGILSRKLDELLKEANIDANLFSSLGESIKSFEGAAKIPFRPARRPARVNLEERIVNCGSPFVKVSVTCGADGGRLSGQSAPRLA